MNSSSWTSAFETGVLALDVDHRMLFGMIDQVRHSSVAQSPTGDKSSLLVLLAATIAHFDREQRLMVDCKYDYHRAAQHEAEHENLLGELLRQIDAFDAGAINAVQIAEFMERWLKAHIMGEDTPLAAAILSQMGTIDRRRSPKSEDHDGTEISSFRRLGPMAPVVWSSKIAVGIDAIDTEHKHLIDCFNAILAARLAANKDAVPYLLETLGDATATHFGNEEKLMADRNYKDSLHHKEEHRRLLEEYGHQVDEWRSGRTSLDALCRFMYGWLLRHIVAMDQPLGESLRTK